MRIMRILCLYDFSAEMMYGSFLQEGLKESEFRNGDQYAGNCDRKATGFSLMTPPYRPFVFFWISSFRSVSVSYKY